MSEASGTSREQFCQSNQAAEFLSWGAPYPGGVTLLFRIVFDQQHSAVLKRRQFIFFSLVLLSVTKLLLQELLRQVLAAGAEGDCQPEHQGSESDSEGNQHGLFRYAHFLKDHGQHEDNDDEANGNTQQAG